MNLIKSNTLPRSSTQGVASQSTSRILLTLCVVALWSVCSGYAQQKAKGLEETQKIAFSAAQIGSIVPPPPLYWLETTVSAAGKPVETYKPIEVPNGMKGATVEIPYKQPVQLYTGTIDPQGKADMKVFLDVPVKSPKDRIFLLFYIDAQGKAKHIFIDDTAIAHPPSTVRFINLTSGKVAFRVEEGKPVAVAPGAEALVKPILRADGRFPFQYFIPIADQPPYQSSISLLRFRKPSSRYLMLFTTLSTISQSSEEKAGTHLPPIEASYSENIYKMEDALPDTAIATKSPEVAVAPVAVIDKEKKKDVEEKNNHDISFFLLSKTPDLGKLEITQGRAKSNISLPLQTLTHARLPGRTGEEATIKLDGKTIGSIQTSGSAQQHLVTLQSDTASDSGFTMKVFENSTLSHPLGQVRIFNLTPYEIAYALGKDTVRINPMMETVVKTPPSGATEDLKIAIQLPKGWELVDTKALGEKTNTMRPCFFVISSTETGKYKLLEQNQ